MRDYREKHPYCQICLVASQLFPGVRSDRTTMATSTHHIENVGMGGLPADHWKHQEGNFLSVCTQCHALEHSDPVLMRELSKRAKELSNG